MISFQEVSGPWVSQFYKKEIHTVYGSDRLQSEKQMLVVDKKHFWEAHD